MLNLSIMPDRFAVCRLDSSMDIASWGVKGDSFSVTKTKEELSIVCLESNVPPHIQAEKGWRAFKVEGPLDFSLTGILASLAQPLAQAKISIFAISTYDTDYLLIKEDKLQGAIEVLEKFCKVHKNTA